MNPGDRVKLRQNLKLLPACLGELVAGSEGVAVVPNYSVQGMWRVRFGLVDAEILVPEEMLDVVPEKERAGSPEPARPAR